MAPTLTWLDSQAHQNLGTVSYGTNAGLYDTQNNTAKMTFVAGRRAGSFAVSIVEDAVTAARLGKTVAAGNRTIVDSLYFKISAAPSTTSNFWQGICTINAQVGMDTTGHIIWAAGSGTNKVSSGTYADGAWHRVDMKWVTSATPFTLDLYIDGVSQTQQVSGATTAADITETRIGSNSAAHTLTVIIQDWVRSVTAGDFPIGAHRCGWIVPTSDGAHNWASTHMGDQAGLVASSVTTLWQAVDDWPASTADFIQAGTSTASTEYAEIALADVDANQVVWGARAVAAIFAAGTAANAATTRIVNGAGATQLDLYVGDQSDTTVRHQANIVPSITSASLLNALKYRLGLPTDANPQPEWAALGIDWAGPDMDWVEPPFISSNTTVFTPSVQALASPPFIDDTAVTYAPTVKFTDSAGFISSNTTVFAPSVMPSAGVPFISSNTTLFAPTIVQTLFPAPGFISSNTTLFAPSVTFTIGAPFIDDTAQVFVPAVFVPFGAPFINDAAQVFAPTVNVVIPVFAPFIDSSAYVFVPVARPQVSAPFIDNTAVIYAPHVAPGVDPPFINNAAQVYLPVVRFIIAPPFLQYGFVIPPGVVHDYPVVPLVYDPSVDRRARLKRQTTAPRRRRIR